MPSITVEPFTARVLVTTVGHVSSVGGIHEEPILLARGEGDRCRLSVAGEIVDARTRR
jgi:hypothetical protein